MPEVYEEQFRFEYDDRIQAPDYLKHQDLRARDQFGVKLAELMKPGVRFSVEYFETHAIDYQLSFEAKRDVHVTRHTMWITSNQPIPATPPSNNPAP